jgi:hypothetical protein
MHEKHKKNMKIKMKKKETKKFVHFSTIYDCNDGL